MDINWNVQNRMPVRMQSNQANSASAMKGIGKIVGNLLEDDVDEQDSLMDDEADVNSKNEDDSGNKTANASKAVSAVAKIISLL